MRSFAGRDHARLEERRVRDGSLHDADADGAPGEGQPRIAILHGPWLLGVDAVSTPNYFDEPSPQNRVVVLAGERVT
jgi:hypothetical protein